MDIYILLPAKDCVNVSSLDTFNPNHAPSYTKKSLGYNSNGFRQALSK